MFFCFQFRIFFAILLFVPAHGDLVLVLFLLYREPENFQMDCETVHEDNLHENTEVDTSEYVPITVGRR